MLGATPDDQAILLLNGGHGLLPFIWTYLYPAQQTIHFYHAEFLLEVVIGCKVFIYFTDVWRRLILLKLGADLRQQPRRGASIGGVLVSCIYGQDGNGAHLVQPLC
jgi:hypothetical protein